jgi:DNA end-binding protein Ku
MASTIWRGFVVFGVISIPVRLFRAARAERVSLRRVRREEPEQASETAADSRAGSASPSSSGTSQQGQQRLSLVPKKTASTATRPPVLTPV